MFCGARGLVPPGVTISAPSHKTSSRSVGLTYTQTTVMHKPLQNASKQYHHTVSNDIITRVACERRK